VPHLKSSKKRLRNANKARMRNKTLRSAMRSAIKKVRQTEDPAQAQQALLGASSLIDRTAKKGIIHKRTAARYKSRLSLQVQKTA
jgi:small subunit ribosomal protein S20